MKILTKKIINNFYKPLYLLPILILLLCSHNLYIKMNTYFLKPNQNTTLSLYNGTFEKSENIITRDRILDASLVFKGNRMLLNSNQWTDKDSTITQFNFTPVEKGTYVAGVSTKARNITLTAKKFNDYLKHDGVSDILKSRTDNNQLDKDAVESYQKHVKAIYQVGDIKTNDWSTVLGYPIEFVPKANPYDKHTGDQLDVQLLLDGKPLANQLVYSNYAKVTHNEEHNHSHGDHKHSHNHNDDDHTHVSNQELRTNDQGIVTLNLPEDGIYYLRTIHMVTVPNSDELTHQSKWATLTFQVTHKHNNDGFPIWFFVLASLLAIGILFFIFRKKS